MQADDATLAALRRQLVDLSHRAYAFNLVPGVSGNLSVRVPGQERILIKATGRSLGDVTEADVLLVDFDGQVIEQTDRRPSKEVFFHLAIYRLRPDVGAVAHLHPPHTLAFAVAHRLPPLLTGASQTFLGDGLVLVPPAPAGSRELVQHIAAAFSNPRVRAAILAEHGTVTVGADLYEAFYLTQYVEDAARTAILAQGLRDRER
jgi:L-fuculose-phosphate aldolase